MKQHQKTIGKTVEWLTPPEIVKALGSFDFGSLCTCKKALENSKETLYD